MITNSPYSQRGLLQVVPTIYTTVKSEPQQEGSLMGVLKSRAEETGPLPREYDSQNRFDAQLDEHGVPVRYPWDWLTLRKNTTESLRALGGHTSRSSVFAVIKIPNRYWRDPIGFSLAKPISFFERGFQEQHCYRVMYKQNRWMQRTLEDRQNNLKGKVQKPVFVRMWNPKTHVTMRCDMPQKTTQKMLKLLGDPLD